MSKFTGHAVLEAVDEAVYWTLGKAVDWNVRGAVAGAVGDAVQGPVFSALRSTVGEPVRVETLDLLRSMGAGSWAILQTRPCSGPWTLT